MGDSVRNAYVEAKPKLRGWLHALAAPATLSAGAFLIVIAGLRHVRAASGPRGIGSARESRLVGPDCLSLYHRL